MTTVFLCWENLEDRKNRVLHIFTSHVESEAFVRQTDGLREWNAGARYYARDYEVQNHNADLAIYHR